MQEQMSARHTILTYVHMCICTIAHMMLSSVGVGVLCNKVEKSLTLSDDSANLYQTRSKALSFNTLLTALEITGLDEVLEGDGPFTVFAPTDEAFEKLPSWLLNYLVNNPALLEKILLYHVVADDLSAEEVILQRDIETANGGSVTARVYDGEVYINRAKVIDADIKASNGRIHVIDSVLLRWF